MATGGSNKKSKDSNGSGGSSSKIDGLGASLVFAGGALAGAAILYGAKKLYDYMSAPEKEEVPKKVDPDEDWEEVSVRPRRGDLSRPIEEGQREESSLMHMSGYSGYSQVPPAETAISPLSDGTSSYLSAASLHDSLLDYYTSYVDIPYNDQEIALRVVEDVKESFRYILDELMPGTPLVGLVNTGPSAQGLSVVRPDFVQVILQLKLDDKLWELVDAGETFLAAHGYQMVRRTHLEFFSRGVTPYDKYLIGEYLSPQKVKLAFLDLTNRVNNWGSEYKIQSAVIGPSVKLDVVYGEQEDEQRPLTIEFIPGVKLGRTQVLATTHTRNVQTPGYDNLWMQSFAEEEMSHLTSWRPNSSPLNTEPKEVSECDTEVKSQDTGASATTQDDPLEASEISPPGCQLMCVKLLEAVRLNHPAQLGMLTSYSVRTIVMHLMTFEDGWLQEELSERFLDTLKALEEYLRSRNLPHFFCPKLNLLADYDPETLELTREFIAAVVGNNQFPALLKTNY